MIDGSKVQRAVDEPRVRVQGLSSAYRRDRPVLDAIDFEVWAGEVVGVLGRNGSGKTTLLRLLTGILEPTAGRVELIARPAFVTDRTPFLESLTARENLLAMLALYGHDASEVVPAAEFWLSRFDLLDDAERAVEEFSLGMRRRLALAEGFAADRGVVLLDEPTTGLDPEGRDRLAESLGEASSKGAAVILATNDADIAERTSDRVVFLHQANIAASGDPREMIARLGAPTLLHIEISGPLPESDPPEDLALVARSAPALTLAGHDAARRLPAVWAWLESADCAMREVKIREPGLADVFRAHTGEDLPAPRQFE